MNRKNEASNKTTQPIRGMSKTSLNASTQAPTPQPLQDSSENARRFSTRAVKSATNHHGSARAQQRQTNPVEPSKTSSASTPIATDVVAASQLPRTAHPDDPLRLTKACVADMRAHLHARRKPLRNQNLDRFVREVLEDDMVVEAYFHPRVIWSDALPLERQGLLRFPVDAALRAASSAFHMGVVECPHERELAYAAALIYPCGLFFCLHPQVRQGYKQSALDSGHIPMVRRFLVEDAMRSLWYCDEGIASTLGEVLGLGFYENVDPAQIGRLGAAVLMANERVATLWTP